MTFAPPTPAGSLAVPAAVAAVVVALAFWPAGFEHLAWDRQAIAAGEAWRVLSGQFVHLGASHAALNLAGLAAVALVFRDNFRSVTWLAALAASLVGVAAGLQWLSASVDWYAGLSGALHGLFAAGAVAWIRGRGERRGAGWVLLGLLAGKLAAEGLYGPSAVTTWLTGGPVLVAAHAWGALGGLASGLALKPRGDGYNPPPRARAPGSGE